jgi:hypothetical protein
MGVSGSQQSQDPEEIHRLVWSAIAGRRPIGAMYKELPRLLCPHRLGWNEERERRLFSYQYGGKSEHGLGPPGAKKNWRCMEFDKLTEVHFLEDPWQTAKNYSSSTCIVQVESEVDDQP